MQSITRRKMFGFAAGALALAGCKSEPPPRPNILFVIADDQSWPHATAYGNTLARTPAFDRIAREGALFHNSFATCPSCTPSRSSILTGRNIWQTGEGGVLYGTLAKDLPLFPHLLENSGYFTGWTGKSWGPGDWKAGGLTRHPMGKEFNTRKHAGAIREGLDPRDYAANFGDFLAARPKDAPFFFWLGSTEPHRAYGKGAGKAIGKSTAAVTVPPFWPDSEEVRGDILDYASEVEWFDQQLTRALQLLEETGEFDNTLIVVTSDNGWPFPRAKVNLYDGGTHMPLAMRWPKRIPSGRAVKEFVSHKDFAPTFLEAAGLKPAAGTAGKSLLPLLQAGAPDPTRDHVITGLERHVMARADGATYPMRAIRTEHFLYIRNFQPDRWPTGGDFISSNKTPHGDVDAGPTPAFMLDPRNQKTFAKQYDLSFGKRPGEELYDLKKDPEQIDNRAGDPAYKQNLSTLRTKLEAYLKETADPRIEGRDPWQQYPYRQTTGYGASFNSTLPAADRDAAAGRARHKPE